MQTFWLVMTIACIAWYSVVTVYVGIKGGADIRHMTRNLAKLKEQSPAQ